ncbi:methyltransferase domain-containing protein [Luteipulveratus halotolerans]|uniref:Methyltransferase type 11 domain-containing protein n=1 Tax=Luteipulveratus halotolerans TaxID=1631356 RepID=A0A0L6CH51_9MICO|nr:methyltransferase domain-containing protein [Luteipulveratus halotolerans]KNX36843.1 hypothetical protein VV01_06270 [Luteipulveratus halotolerans]
MGWRAELKRVRGDRLARTIARAHDDKLDRLIAHSERQADLLDRLLARQTQQDATIAELRTRVEALTPTASDATPSPSAGTSDQDSWRTKAQVGELGFHVHDTFRQHDEQWWPVIDGEWREMGFSPEGWRDRTVVDVGAGSRLRSLWFEGASIIAIEPLADQYMEQVAWSDLTRATEVYSVPGETFVPEVEGRADLVVSINALDHGYDLATSIGNIGRYLKPGATAFVSFDMHDTVTDEMHPMVVRHDDLVELFPRIGLKLVRTAEHSRRYHGATGPKARHYWLQQA